MPFRILPGSVERRFWSKVKKTSECWLWLGSKSDFGHGQVRINGELFRAHRVSWLWANGTIPDGKCVLHKCDVPNCVNPDHLFLGTKADNTQDMMAKNRHKFTNHYGESSGTSKLSKAQVTEIRKLFINSGGILGKGKYRRGALSQKKLGEMFGVSQVQIGNILRGDQWTSEQLQQK